MARERRGTVLVIDDDVSRHPDLEAWGRELGTRFHVAAAPPPGLPGPAPLACLVMHAGYGRMRPGFPGKARRAEAVRWLLGDASYLFHEDLDALAALGRALPPDVPVALMTGGSIADLPLDELRKLAPGRAIVAWNVFGLLSTRSVREIAAGPDTGTPRSIESQLRHDLLSRLWNLAIAAAESSPDVEEIERIIAGDPHQAPLGDLIEASRTLDCSIAVPLQKAMEAASRRGPVTALATLAHRAIEAIEAQALSRASAPASDTRG